MTGGVPEKVRITGRRWSRLGERGPSRDLLRRLRVDNLNGGCFVGRPAVDQRVARVGLRLSVSCEMVVLPVKENLERISVCHLRTPVNYVRDLLGVGDIPLIDEPGEMCCRGGVQMRTRYSGGESPPPTESLGSARTIRIARAYAPERV